MILTQISERGGKLLDDEAIATEFQQHKLIIAAFKNLRRLADSSVPESQRWSGIEELERIVSAHMKEEDDVLFPLLMNRIQQQDDEFRESESKNVRERKKE